MNEYEFTLKFSLQDSQLNPNDYVEVLHENGCDDALIGTGRQGCIALNFIREAPSAYEAVSTAIIDVRKALPKASLIEASPDFVGLTDVAKLLGCTRQNIRNLIIKWGTTSPSPIYEGTPSIWHLAEILIWLSQDKMYAIDDVLLEIAKTNMDFNIARSWQKIKPGVPESMIDLVA